MEDTPNPKSKPRSVEDYDEPTTEWQLRILDERNAWIMEGNTYLVEMVAADDEQLYERDMNKRFANMRKMAAAPNLIRALQYAAAGYATIMSAEDGDVKDWRRFAEKNFKAALAAVDEACGKA